MISFQEKYPEYSKYWDNKKNNKKPNDVSYGSGTKYWWKCEKNHNWLASPNAMSRGVRCPYCSGLLPIIGETDLATTHPYILKKWNYSENNKLNIKPTDFKYGSKTKVYWLCEKGHTWVAPISRITIENRNCPYCSNQKVLKGFNDLASKYPDLLEEWNYDKNSIKPEDVIFGSSKKVWWKCKDCGYEWQTTIAHRTGIHKTNCPKCAPRHNRGEQLFCQIKLEGSFGDNYPELLKEWDYDRNIGIDPFKLVSKSSIKVHWLCAKGHKWEAIVASRTRHNGTGCPVCAGKTIEKGFNDFKSQQSILMKEWDFKRNNEMLLFPDKVTCHSAKKVWWICPSCGNSYKSAISHRVNGTACPKCANELKTSFCEQAIYYYLSKVFKTDNRWNRIGKEIDIFIYELNLGIEYDGEFYHQGKKSLMKEKEKYEELKDKGITLIRVKENFKNKKLKSYADYTIEVNKINYDREIPKIINKIVDYINFRWNLDVKIEINLKKERQDIYNQYIMQKKENSVAALFPDKIKDWDYRKNKISPDNITPGSSKIIWWRCKEGHSYESILANHIKHNCKCQYCSNQKVLKGFNDLESRFPNRAKDWDYEKNHILPSDILPFSNKKYWWKCKKGHSYLTTPNARCSKTKHAGCPICSGRKILVGYNDLKSQRPKIAEEWDYKKNKSNPENYTIGSNYKAYWKCKKGHSYLASIYSRTKKENGTGCPVCNGKKVLVGYNDFKSQRPDLLIDWDYDKNIIKPDEAYVNSMKKVHWKCHNCGNEWETTLYSRCVQNRGCNVCSSIRTGQKHIDNLIKKQGSLKDNKPKLIMEWDYIKNIIDPSKVTIGSHKKAWWKCNVCGYEWNTEIRVRTIRGSGCPICSKKKKS